MWQCTQHYAAHNAKRLLESATFLGGPFKNYSKWNSATLCICPNPTVNNAQCRILTKIWPFLPCFSRQNWRVIFEVFQSNFGFAWLNSTVRSLVWENEWNNWKLFTCSLRSHNFKSVNIYGKIRQCDNGKSRNSYGFEAKAKSREIITQLLDSWRAWLIWWPLI